MYMYTYTHMCSKTILGLTCGFATGRVKRYLGTCINRLLYYIDTLSYNTLNPFTSGFSIVQSFATCDEIGQSDSLIPRWLAFKDLVAKGLIVPKVYYVHILYTYTPKGYCNLRHLCDMVIGFNHSIESWHADMNPVNGIHTMQLVHISSLYQYLQCIFTWRPQMHGTIPGGV